MVQGTTVYVRESKVDGRVELLDADDFGYRIQGWGSVRDCGMEGKTIETDYNRFYVVDSHLPFNAWGK